MAQSAEKQGPLSMEQREVDALTTGRASAGRALAKRLGAEVPSRGPAGRLSRTAKVEGQRPVTKEAPDRGPPTA
jgi:hypothetical protein